MRRVKAPEVRFWSKVQGGSVDECWVWKGALTKYGYGKFFTHKLEGRTVLVGSHRWAYEHLRTEIPTGLHLDHLCRNRACVNPWHLEPVTPAINIQRGVSTNGSKTHCKRGHEFTAENTGRQKSGRYCIACKRISDGLRWSK